MHDTRLKEVVLRKKKPKKENRKLRQKNNVVWKRLQLYKFYLIHQKNNCNLKKITYK